MRSPWLSPRPRPWTGTPRRRLAVRPLTGVALLVLSAGLLGACGADERPSADDSDSKESSTSTPSSPETSAGSSSPGTDGSASPPATSTPADSFRAQLLSADKVGKFNETWTWSEGATGPQRKALGVCAKHPLTTLGAERAVQRTFVPTGDDGSGAGAQAIARFPDERSVQQAVAVVKKWQTTCKQRISKKYGFVKVGAFAPVKVSGGTAQWNLVTYSPADADSGNFEAIGILAKGNQLSILRLDLAGYDYNYPRGKEPMATTLRNAAALLSDG